MNQDDYVIEINPAIEIDGVQYDQIRLREPRLAEIKIAEAQLKGKTSPDITDMRRYEEQLITSVSGIPASVIPQLTISTYNKVMKVLNGFLYQDPPTG